MPRPMSFIRKEVFMQEIVLDIRGRIAAPRGMPQIPEGLRPYFRDVSHGAVKAGKDEIAGNPRSGSVRLRAVELTLPLPPAVRNEMLRDIELAEQGKEKRR